MCMAPAFVVSELHFEASTGVLTVTGPPLIKCAWSAQTPQRNALLFKDNTHAYALRKIAVRRTKQHFYSDASHDTFCASIFLNWPHTHVVPAKGYSLSACLTSKPQYDYEVRVVETPVYFRPPEIHLHAHKSTYRSVSAFRRLRNAAAAAGIEPVTSTSAAQHYSH